MTMDREISKINALVKEINSLVDTMYPEHRDEAWKTNIKAVALELCQRDLFPHIDRRENGMAYHIATIAKAKLRAGPRQ